MRMETQQEQLAPLMIAAKQSRAELQEAEELQVRATLTIPSFCCRTPRSCRCAPP